MIEFVKVKLTNPGKNVIREISGHMDDVEQVYDLDGTFEILEEDSKSAWLMQGNEHLVIPKTVIVDDYIRHTYHRVFEWMQDPEIFGEKLRKASEGLSPEEWKAKLKRAGIG